MASLLSDSTPKSIEQAENDLFLFTHPPAPSTPAETDAADTVTLPDTDQADESIRFAEVIRQRFEAQRQRMAQHLTLINDVRQTISQLRRLIEKPPPSE